MSDVLTRLERMEKTIDASLAAVQAHQAASAEQHKALAEKVDDIDEKTCLLKRVIVGDLDEPEKKGLLERMNQAESGLEHMRREIHDTDDDNPGLLKRMDGAETEIRKHGRFFALFAGIVTPIGLAVLARAGDNLWDWWTGRK